ncbi:MAG TPA: RNA 2',3'-cyclic phosphodiesterase [Dehalococcoidales bacterium]|nr:RNA 2',3'-cyclic phosphodiesterase [Dehalococcoidales bacterium]
MAQIRAFIAIEIPAEIKIHLKVLQDQIKPAGIKSVKWVEPANLHLTLKFLGNISPSQIQPVITAMQSAVQFSHSFHLQIDSLGAFPDLNRVQVIWSGLKGELDTLLKLQKSLDDQLARVGFVAEKRPFSAHLTLGRMRENATLFDRQNLGKKIRSCNPGSSPLFKVSTLHLMQSQLLPSGPIYTPLESIVLPEAT